jgi:hypothetical protein
VPGAHDCRPDGQRIPQRIEHVRKRDYLHCSAWGNTKIEPTLFGFSPELQAAASATISAACIYRVLRVPERILLPRRLSYRETSMGALYNEIVTEIEKRREAPAPTGQIRARVQASGTRTRLLGGSGSGKACRASSPARARRWAYSAKTPRVETKMGLTNRFGSRASLRYKAPRLLRLTCNARPY